MDELLVGQTDTATPLTNSWKNPLWRQLLPAGLFLLVGCCVLPLDIPIARALVKEGRLRAIHPFLERTENFGDAIVALLIIACVGLCDLRRRRAVPRLIASAIAAGLLADLVKLSVMRLRPNDHPLTGSVLSTFRGWFPGHSAGFAGQSCPSAHTALAVGLCLGLGTLYPRGRPFFIAITACVALQRVETGAHFLSDTLFGAAVGYLAVLAMYRPAAMGFWFDRLEGCDSTKCAGSSINSESHPPVSTGDILASTDAGSTILRPLQTEAEPLTGVSAVIPVYNEELNVPRMYAQLKPVLESLGYDWEIVFVDDGSRDATNHELQRLARQDLRVKVVTFRRNYGQTAAMSAGIRYATGDAIVLLDGDLQNDPTDIPRMLEKLSEGYDLVHGWRKDRQDRFLDRKLPSLIANRIISRVTGFPVHDLGCTLKVIRSNIAKELNLYGEMHRFIPILAHHRGARCIEVVTKHHARQFGTSKYGISRTFRVLFDLLTVQFITQYIASPMKYFGKLGLACFGVGGLSGLATVAMKVWQQTDMTGNPLLLGCVFASLLGMQFLSLGLLGELVSRIYLAAEDRAIFTVRHTSNLESRTDEEPASPPLTRAA